MRSFKSNGSRSRKQVEDQAVIRNASPCPQCGSMARRLFSPVPIVFKGSGFYVTDHRKNSDHGTDEAKRLMDECKPKTEPAKKENK